MVDHRDGRRAERSHVLAALEALNERIGREMARRLGAAGVELRGSEGRILNLIATTGTRPTDLAAGAWISKQAMAKRIKGLEERGLVRMETDPIDKRAVLVHLTAEGERVRDVTARAIAALERDFARELGASRYREFRRVVDDLAAGG